MVVKCEELIYTPINAISFRVSGGIKSLKAVLENNVIQSLNDKDGPLLALGSTVEIKKKKYKVNLIQKTVLPVNSYYTISIAKRTKSSTFLMPMLGGHRDLYFWNTLFVNCFITREDDTDCIAVLYKWSSDLLYIKFEKALTKFKNFRRRYDPTPNYVMFVFEVPKKHVRNYKKFINGKYSQFSKSYKFELLEFHDKDIHDELGQVLFKGDKRRKALEKKLGTELPENSEVLSIIDVEQETYNSEIYKFKKSLI